MTRSLYDSNQTSNLRDDIIRATKVIVHSFILCSLWAHCHAHACSLAFEIPSKSTHRLLNCNAAATNTNDDGDCAQRGNGSVVVEIEAASTDAQLLIRELVEDSPSMTAFSTTRSALKKSGLFFVILVAAGCPLTPELASRASVVI